MHTHQWTPTRTEMVKLAQVTGGWPSGGPSPQTPSKGPSRVLNHLQDVLLGSPNVLNRQKNASLPPKATLAVTGDDAWSGS